MPIRFRRIWPVLLCCLVWAGAACEPSHDGDDPTDDDADDEVTDDDLSPTDDDSAEDTPAAGTMPYNVLEREDLGAEWECRRPGYCIEDYRRFLRLAKDYAEPIPRDEIRRQLRAIDDGEVELVPGPLSADELRGAIVDILNIPFLLDGINGRLLVVTTIDIVETADYYEYHLLFQDGWVGVFEGYLLTPKGEGPFPAVVAIHGHDDDARIYRDRYHGSEYPAHGYAILMLTMRAMSGGVASLVEHNIALDLLTDSFTLIGLRVYETLLGAKYLRYLPGISEDRIGLIGHSGGSSAGNLTVRVDPGIAAYVSDYTVDYAEWVPVLGIYHCETVPELYPYNLLINDFATSSTPILSVPYGYTNGMDEIFSFFDEYLKG
jgi:hypothetical protein